MAEIIEKTGKSYNIFDKINNVWNKCSFWTHSNDVFYPDGKSATTKHSAINGITSDLSGEAEDIAASIKCVNQLNSSLETLTTPNTVKVYDEGNDNYIELLLYGKIVICQGALSNKTGTITTFPEQYRPIKDIRFNAHGNNDGTLYKNGDFYSNQAIGGFFNFTYLLA